MRAAVWRSEEALVATDPATGNDLERRGKLIGANDMLIAAHALTANLIVVTDNVGEFKRVTGLKVRNWLKPT